MGSSPRTEEPQQWTTWVREQDNSLASSAGTPSVGGCQPLLWSFNTNESHCIFIISNTVSFLKKKLLSLQLHGKSKALHFSFVSWHFRQVWELDWLFRNAIWWATEKCYPRSSKAASFYCKDPNNQRNKKKVMVVNVYINIYIETIHKNIF